MTNSDKRTNELLIELGIAEAVHVLDQCESPIETWLGLALMTRMGLRFRSDVHRIDKENTAVYDGIVERSGMSTRRPVATADRWLLFCQAQVKRYRLDFAVVSRVGQIAIETDGHDFHERTKEQARRDKSRDRELQRLGWRVLRFTGSEVYADPNACAEEVFGLMFKLDPDMASQWAPIAVLAPANDSPGECVPSGNELTADAIALLRETERQKKQRMGMTA